MEINIQKLEKEMARTGLKKAELAKAMGMYYQNLDYILRTRRTKLDTIQKMADFFEIDAKDLLI